MAQTISHAGSTLTTVPPDSIRVVEAAYMGDAGSGSAMVYDDAGTLTITGLKSWTITQSSAPVNSRRVFTGYVADRTYRRGEAYSTGAGREIDVTLVDVNTTLMDYVISGTDGKRPAESVGNRLAWLIGSSYVTFVDGGLVIYPSANMDKTDYRGRTAADVLNDCSMETGYNFFLYYKESTDQIALFFDNSNISTAFASTTKISNVAADVDGTTVLAPSQDGELARDPAKVASGFYVPYARGATLRTKAATATAFRTRQHVAPNSDVKTLARAQRLGDRLLEDNDEEEDIIRCSVWVAPANVNDIRAGHRIECKFSHFANEGYGSYTWFRVLRRTVSQPDNTDQRYQIDLELSPTATASSCNPDTATDRAAGVAATGYTSNSAVLTAPSNPTNVTDGNDFTSSQAPYQLINPAYIGQTFYRGWVLPIASSVISYVEVRKVTGEPFPTVLEYWNGSAYVVPVTIFDSFAVGTTNIFRWRLMDQPTTTSIRVTYLTYAGGGLPFNYSAAGLIRVEGIRVLGC